MWRINGYIARMVTGYRTRNRGLSGGMMTVSYEEDPRLYEVVVPEGYVAEVGWVRNQHFAMKEHFAVWHVMRVRIDVLNDVCVHR